MNTDPSKQTIIAKNLRGVARVWSVLVFILAVILMIGTRFDPPGRTMTNAAFDVLVPLSLLISMLGLAIAWRWEGWGVLINLGFYLAVLPLYWLLHREWIHLSIMVALSPVILPGVLFAAAWLLSRKEKPQEKL